MSPAATLLDERSGRTPAGVADQAAVAALARAAGSSFFWAMRLLPAKKRQAMFGVYAFCREVDDIADAEGLPPPERLHRLEAWQAEIEAVYRGRPATAIGRVLLAPVHEVGLEQTEFEAIIDGMRMDAEAAIRAPSLALLELYCRRVAVSTGRLSVMIFGERGERGRRVADHLGRALQLTNILRDLDEDAALGRLYLPRELLDAHGIDAREPRAVVAHPGLHAACVALAGEAAASFAAADAALALCDRRAMRPAVVMRQVYGRLLDGLVARGWADRRRNPSPGRATKLWLALRHGVL
jgi:squalene synthase HpnD